MKQADEAGQGIADYLAAERLFRTSEGEPLTVEEAVRLYAQAIGQLSQVVNLQGNAFKVLLQGLASRQ